MWKAEDKAKHIYYARGCPDASVARESSCYLFVGMAKGWGGRGCKLYWLAGRCLHKQCRTWCWLQMWHRGPKPILTFLLNHILHCICFKIFFTGSKYLVSNWNYTCLIRTIKKWRKWIKKFKIFRVIIILCNHHFTLHFSEIILGNKGLYSVSYKRNGIKIRLQLYTL